MSTSLCKAIGYGMPWNDFESATTLDCQAHETWDALNHAFEMLGDADFTVDEVSCDLFFHGEGLTPVLEQRLLSKNDTDGGLKDADLGAAEELMTVVVESDDRDPQHVIFYPNLQYADEWQHRNDSVDIAFESWRGGNDRFYDPELRSFAKYIPYGHYPFKNFLMLEDGTPQKWRFFKELQKRPDIVPAVPSEIRWYLTKHGILDDHGVNRLRPIIAQWWS